MKNWVIWAVAALVLAGVFTTLAHGQCANSRCQVPAQINPMYPLPPTQATAQRNPAIVRVTRYDVGRSGGSSQGTGAYCGADDKKGIGFVFTAAHNIADGRGAILVDFGNDQQAWATVAHVQKDQDWACLYIKKPAHDPLEVSDLRVASNAQVIFVGWGSGWAPRRGAVSRQWYGPAGRGSVSFWRKARVSMRMGDSGCPVFYRGRMVGVLWGSDNAEATYTPMWKIMRVMSSRYSWWRNAWIVRSRPVLVPVRPATTSPQIPAPQAPAPQVPPVAQVPPQRATEVCEGIEAIRAEIAALREEIKAMKIKPGPPGARGAQGKRGPPGAIPLTDIVSAVTEKVAAELKPITVQTYVNGKLTEAKDVYLGETLTLNLEPVGD